MSLPTDRTTGDSNAEHVTDHNVLHAGHNSELGARLATVATKSDINNIVTYPTSGNSVTLHTLTGAGVVRHLQFTNGVKNGAKYGRLQIFVDGEVSPSFDAEIGTLFGLQEDAWQASGAFLAARHMSVSVSGSDPYPGTSSAAMKFPIPYSNGCVIKFKNPGQTMTGQFLYSACQYQEGEVPGLTDRWRLRTAGDGLLAGGVTVEPEEVADLFTITDAGVLVWVGAAGDAVTNYTLLERPWDCYIDGEEDPSYQGNSEDWWNSGFFFGGMTRLCGPSLYVTIANHANFTFAGGVDLLDMVGGIKFAESLDFKHGTTYSIKDDQYVTTDATVGAVGLYYADLS